MMMHDKLARAIKMNLNPEPNYEQKKNVETDLIARKLFMDFFKRLQSEEV